MECAGSYLPYGAVAPSRPLPRLLSLLYHSRESPSARQNPRALGPIRSLLAEVSSISTRSAAALKKKAVGFISAMRRWAMAGTSYWHCIQAWSRGGFANSPSSVVHSVVPEEKHLLGTRMCIPAPCLAVSLHAQPSTPGLIPVPFRMAGCNGRCGRDTGREWRASMAMCPPPSSFHLRNGASTAQQER